MILKKLKLCFDILDYDGDGKLSISDVLSIMHKQQETDILNMNDLELLLKFIKQPSLLANISNKRNELDIKERLNRRISFMQPEIKEIPANLQLTKATSSKSSQVLKR